MPCDFCGAGADPAIIHCACAEFPTMMRDLASFVQKELHEHLPGYYFSPKDVYACMEKFFGKKNMGRIIVEEEN